jgi:hypothetical protein
MGGIANELNPATSSSKLLHSQSGKGGSNQSKIFIGYDFRPVSAGWLE